MFTKILVLASLFSLPAFSLEHEKNDQSHTQHTIFAENVKALELTFSQRVTINGSCNRARFYGSLKEVKLPAGDWARYKPYVADIGAGQTEIGCPGVTLQDVSMTKTIKANERGQVGIDILVPKDIELNVLEVN